MEQVFVITGSQRNEIFRTMDEIILAMNNGDTNWAMELASKCEGVLDGLTELKYATDAAFPKSSN